MKAKNKVSVLIGILIPMILNAQSSDQNYVLTRICQNDSSTAYIDAIQYFDGLGNPSQIVQRGITPLKQDLITLWEYDSLGRQNKTWLPVMMPESGNFINSSTVKNEITNMIEYNNDAVPYSQSIYEASPLNRLLKQYSPGEDWTNKGRFISSKYLTNDNTDSLKCRFYQIQGVRSSYSIKRMGDFPPGQLSVVSISDENNNCSFEFKNSRGLTILNRNINQGQTYDTYFIYDEFDNLCYVLPPLVTDQLTQSNVLWNETNEFIAKYGYIYIYDNKNRCISKKLPDIDPFLFIYDNTDRLTFTQDGEQRKRNENEWTIMIYDIFDRVALTGLINNMDFYLDDIWETGMMKHDLSSSSIKDCVSNGEIAFYAKYTNNSSLLGYDLRLCKGGILASNPVGDEEDSYTFMLDGTIIMQSVNYYDNYSFMDLPGGAGIPNTTNTQYNAETGYGVRYDEGKGYEAKGQITGTMTAQYLSDGTLSPTYLYSVMYYDNRGRLIQTKSNNHQTGGVDKKYIAYNFTGQPIKTQTIQRVILENGQAKETTELYTHLYDHAGRLLETRHKLNNEQELILTKNEYDELGRLKKVYKGGDESLPIEYEYNIRSWTTNISSPHFNQKLYYNERNGNNIPQYNGNISAIEWNNGMDNGNRAYNFSYDHLSRLTAANYTRQANEKYGTSYSYDKHGNMLTLERQGKTDAANYGVIDKLAFVYNGNQLKTITDAATDINIAESSDFKGNATADVHYAFNKNGAMTQDLNKGIDSIRYNSLNLPQEMVINSSSARAKNYYTYSASGVKLRVEQRYDPDLITNPVVGTNPGNDGLSKSKITDYVGNKIYENGELKKILVDGGYYDYEKQEYFFYIQDHLGNNRVVVNQKDSVVQRNDYYPFGMEFADNSGNDQPYKYNGKELDKMHGLNMYDYSARYVDPAIGRFTSVDPHAENYYSWSPYHYGGNNPMKITDPTGMDWFVNGQTGNVFFVSKVNNLRDINTTTRKFLEEFGDFKFDDLSIYENLGADNIFGDKIVEGLGVKIVDDTEHFMWKQGYEPVDRIRVQQTISNEYRQDGGHESRVEDKVLGRYKSYANSETELYAKKFVSSQDRYYSFSSVGISISDYKVPIGTTEYKKESILDQHEDIISILLDLGVSIINAIF